MKQSSIGNKKKTKKIQKYRNEGQQINYLCTSQLFQDTN